MKTLDLLIPYVAPLVVGCPDPVILQALRQAAIEFCSRADLIQRIFTLDVVAGQPSFSIDAPGNMTLARVIQVNCLDQRLTPANPDSVYSGTAVRGASIGTDLVRTGRPTSFFQVDPGSAVFHVYPVPDFSLTAGLTVRAAFNPSQNALTVDDVLVDQFGDDLAQGATARLMMQPGQQWTAVEAAARYQTQFDLAVSTARRQKEMGQTSGSQRIMPRRFV